MKSNKIPLKIVFVCYGNICRSPLAEFIFKKMVHEAGKDYLFEISSMATSAEELGNPPYPPICQLLKSQGIDWGDKKAVRLSASDYDKYHMFIGMDRHNVYDMERLFGGDPENKVSLFLSYAGLNRDVADPWFTRDFKATWKDVEIGCKALLEELS